LGGGVSISKPLKLIEQYVNEDKLRASSIDYGLITVDITNRWAPLEVFKEDVEVGTLGKYILASAYFPIFKREELVGKKFFDGGLYDNLPINPLIRKGYDEIITIRTMSNLPGQKVIDGTVKVNHITPSESLGRTFDFAPDKIAYNLELGYYDALRFTDNLEGVKYYIKPFETSTLYHFLYNQPISVYKAWAQELDVKGTRIDIINALFDFIRNNYGKGVLTNEKTLFLELLERYAMNLGIYRLKIYDTFFEFINEIKGTAIKNTLMNDTKAEKIVNALLQININDMEN
jgi:NTE family protein